MTVLAEFTTDLDDLQSQGENAFAAAMTLEMLEAARIKFLGASEGRLRMVQTGLRVLSTRERASAGKRLKEVKGALGAALTAAEARIKQRHT